MLNDEKSAARDPVCEPRYSLNAITLGKLEQLAKARFILSESVPDFDPAKVSKDDTDTARSIVRGVFASSEIEGEGISAEYMDAFVAAHTEPVMAQNAELQLRLQAHTDIIDTYWWALAQRSGPVISNEFVIEMHRRMFSRAKPDIAGRIKDREIYIRWRKGGGEVVEVPTISPEYSDDYLRALCNRTDQLFRLGQKDAEAPLLLTAAEFVCDFLAIHPFSDGNGRAARLLATCLLERAGYHFTRIYPLDQVVLDTRAEYYEALNRSQRNWHTTREDLSPWIAYFVDSVFEQWERAFRSVKSKAARDR